MKGLFAGGVAAALAMFAVQPAAAQNCAPLKQMGNIQMVRQGGPWLIPMGINGTPKYMILDTGAGATYITPETVAELKLPRRESRTALLISSTGMRSYAATYVERLAIGLAGQFSNSYYTIDVELPNGAKRPPGAPAGRVGLELLSHFDFDLNLKKGVLNLFSHDHCEGQVVYWKTDAAVAVPFDWNTQGRIRFKVMLDGKQLYAVLDTTDPDDTLNLTYYKSQVGFDEKAPGVEMLGQGGDGGKIYRATFKSLDIGGLNISNPSMLLREDKLAQQTMGIRASTGTNVRNGEDNRAPDITLGAASLAKLHVYVATKERKLYISAAPD